nr:RNA-directed DNA polymerase, eukaryota, nucleotide-binding alpha-beta plait domain protein [Tanacetum cinerariifolium]
MTYMDFDKNMGTENRSFTSILNAGSGIPSKATKPSLAIVLDDDCLIKRDYSCSLMGKIKDINALPNLYMILSNEGFENVKLTYLGGLWVLLDTDSIETKEKVFNHIGVGSWFSGLQSASNSFICDEHIIWIFIKGVPIKAMNHNTFSKIASLRGELTNVDDSESTTLSYNRLCVKVKSSVIINDIIKVIVKGNIFWIQVKELEPCPLTLMKNKKITLYLEMIRFVMICFMNENNLVYNHVSKSLELPSKSSDPFGIYNLLGKNKDKVVLEENKDHVALDKSDPQFPPGASILDVMDELIKVSRAMGYNMDRCLGQKAKKGWIQELNLKHHVSFVALQETKMESIDLFSIHSLWGNFDFDYVFSPYVGFFGGIHCTWDPSLFQKDNSTVFDSFVAIRDECVFLTAVDWQTNASKDGMPANGTYSVEAVRALDTHQMDLFSLIRALNLTKVKTESRPPVAADPLVARESRKRGRDGIDATAPPKSLRRDHVGLRPSGSSHKGKSLAAMQLCMASNVFVSEGAPADVSDPDPSSQGVVAARDPESENVSSPAEVGSPGSVYRPEWGVTNGSLLDTPEACQDLVDHAAPSGYFSELRHMHNEDFLGQYNINLARQVAMGGSPGPKNPSPGVRNKKPGSTAGDRGMYEEGFRREECWVDALQQQVSGEETLKATFEEYKRQQDQMVEQRCAEIDARLDALSIDFDEELYPHMLTAIAGRRWVIGHGLRLAMMKCAESLEMRQAFVDVVSTRVAKGMSEGLKHGVEHGHAQLTVESLEAYDPEAKAKFAAALQSLKDLKYPLLDQLEGLNDAPMDVIMAALYLKSDTGGDALQFIRDLRPSSSQLAIPVYPEVRDPRNPWAYKEEIKLSDAIAANISRAEKKKKCRIVCHTHGVGSAHHARSDGVPVSVPTVVPQGLALLLVDAATQTDFEDTLVL